MRAAGAKSRRILKPYGVCLRSALPRLAASTPAAIAASGLKTLSRVLREKCALKRSSLKLSPMTSDAPY